VKAYLVDTNVLLDVLGADKKYGALSLRALNACAKQGVLVINPVIFAEVGVYVPLLEELNSLLPETLFRRDALPWEAAFLASQAFKRYKQNKHAKKRILADFLIGAHAVFSGLSLISRDTGYLHYFKIDLINPELI
jgi:predicted nucleic acid-binding protein